MSGAFSSRANINKDTASLKLAKLMKVWLDFEEELLNLDKEEAAKNSTTN